jgi:hypothetical protein
MTFDINIWGPNYIFFLQSMAFSYPMKPNDTIKKKFFEFYNNIPLFIPNDKFFKFFTTMIDKHPVAPYLDSQLTLLKWTHKITNEINSILLEDEIDFDAFMDSYYLNFKDKNLIKKENSRFNEKILYGSIISVAVITILLLYNR